MTNKRFQSLNEYEQLKRKNRRRLVGASALVIVAGFILAKALNQSGGETEAENITIQTASSVQTAPQQEAQVFLPNHAASSDDASDLSPAAVLEPAPEGNTQSIELNNPLTAPAPTEAETAPQPVLEPAPAPSAETASPATAIAKQQTTTKPETKPETPSEKTVSDKAVKESAQPAPARAAKPVKNETPETEADNAPPPVVIINNRVEPDPQAEAARKAAEKKAAEQKAAKQKAAQEKAAQEAQRAKTEAAAKETEREKAVQQAKQEAGRLKAQQQAKAKAEAEKKAAEAARKKQQEANTQAAQNALANKAPRTTEKSDPKAILEGKSNSKAVIQIGAYGSSRQAQQMQQKLADAGISAYVSETETSKGKVYRVRTGSYPNREAAGKALEKIRQKGADGMVIGQQ